MLKFGNPHPQALIRGRCVLEAFHNRTEQQLQNPKYAHLQLTDLDNKRIGWKHRGPLICSVVYHMTISGANIVRQGGQRTANM